MRSHLIDISEKNLEETYELLNLYGANLFSEVRQLHYSERNNNSLDLVLFLNGLPIFTAELKNPFTGQNVEDAIKQYRFFSTNDHRSSNSSTVASASFASGGITVSLKAGSSAAFFYPRNHCST